MPATLTEAKVKRIDAVQLSPNAQVGHQRLVVIDDAEFFRFTYASRAVEFIQNVVWWTDWPVESRKDEQHWPGLVIGFPHISRFQPSGSNQARLFEDALRLVTNYMERHLAVMMYNPYEEQGAYYRTLQDDVGSPVKADFVFNGREPQGTTFLEAFNDATQESFGMRFTDKENDPSSVTDALRLGSVHVNNKRQTEIGEIILIRPSGNALGFKAEAYQLRYSTY
jgi:hypothetical protein